VDVPWQDRAHFIAVCARAMRRILVDHARAKQAAKRGGDAAEVHLNIELTPAQNAESAVIALDEALEKLMAYDARKGSVIELHYFGGLKHSQIATVLSISLTTVERELKAAKEWLRRQMV